jgi:hypothetical protein
MTAPDGRPHVEIRPPRTVRVLGWSIVAVGLALVLGPSAVDAARNGDWGAVLLYAVVAVAAIAIAARTTGMVVLSTPEDRLLVRNQLRTRTLERFQIEDVRRAPGGFAQRAGLDLLLRDGTVVALQAATPPGPGAHQRDLEAQQETLRRWLAS